MTSISTKGNGVAETRCLTLEQYREAVRTGEVRFKTAPPTITKVEVPQFSIKEDDRRTGLSRAKESILQRRKKLKDDKEAQKESIRQFRAWMWGVALPFIRDVAQMVVDPEVGPEILEEEYVGPEGEDKKEITIGGQRDEFRKEIDRYQKCNDPTIALNLLVAEQVFWLSTEGISEEKLSLEFDRMIDQKILEENPMGSIESFRRIRFSLHQRFLVLEEEERNSLAQEIKGAIDEQVQRLRREARKALEEAENQMAERRETLLKKHTMRPIDLFEGADGMCLFVEKNRKGFLLLQAEGNHITCVEGAGYFKESFESLKGLEATYGSVVSIERRSLKNSSGQLRNSQNPPEIQVPSVVAGSDFKFWISAGRFIWHTSRNILALVLGEELQEREEQNPEPAERKREFKKFVPRELTRAEFYQRNFFGYYDVVLEQWVWWVKDQKDPKNGAQHQETVQGLHLRIERFKGEEGERRLRVVSFSQEHKEFLEKVGCLDPKGYFDSENGCKSAFLDKVLSWDDANGD